MAHEIKFWLQSVELTKVDSWVEVKKDNKLLGRITVSKGGIDYQPKRRQKEPIKLTWTQFDLLMKKWESGEIKL